MKDGRKSLKDNRLPKVWNEIKKFYKLKKIIGRGGFGLVVKAVHLQSKKTFAIKHIDNIFKDDYSAKKIVREIQIMRKLSEFKDNGHTVKLHDIIANDELGHVFIVMEYFPMDLKKALD